jgi:hypothetical protein
VAEEQSFERAALYLHITRGAVSQRIRGLEESLATVLLVRDKPVVPTACGEVLLRHVKALRLLEGGTLRELDPAPHDGAGAARELNVLTELTGALKVRRLIDRRQARSWPGAHREMAAAHLRRPLPVGNEKRALSSNRPKIWPLSKRSSGPKPARTPRTGWPRTSASTRRVILDITSRMPMAKVCEYNDDTFDFARKHRDIVFGRCLNFDPQRKDERLAE